MISTNNNPRILSNAGMRFMGISLRFQSNKLVVTKIPSRLKMRISG
ncbi:Uncharacterised protein [Vibrio cholerae]|nr:Uncharacterised protein [Vibrio cholerae]CSB54768.1 Uncharacterised protein [Vibrio cholerae]